MYSDALRKGLYKIFINKFLPCPRIGICYNPQPTYNGISQIVFMLHCIVEKELGTLLLLLLSLCVLVDTSMG